MWRQSRADSEARESAARPVRYAAGLQKDLRTETFSCGFLDEQVPTVIWALLFIARIGSIGAERGNYFREV